MTGALVLFGVPSGLMTAGALVKTIVRHQWKLEDWCVGPDSILAAAFGGVLYLLDLAEMADHGDGAKATGLIVRLCAFLFLTICLFLATLALHGTMSEEASKLDLFSRTTLRHPAFWGMAVGSNLVGWLMLVTMIYVKQGRP